MNIETELKKLTFADLKALKEFVKDEIKEKEKELCRSAWRQNEDIIISKGHFNKFHLLDDYIQEAIHTKIYSLID
jgi:hypothetical protein